MLQRGDCTVLRKSREAKYMDLGKFASPWTVVRTKVIIYFIHDSIFLYQSVSILENTVFWTCTKGNKVTMSRTFQYFLCTRTMYVETSTQEFAFFCLLTRKEKIHFSAIQDPWRRTYIRIYSLYFFREKNIPHARCVHTEKIRNYSGALVQCKSDLSVWLCDPATVINTKWLDWAVSVHMVFSSKGEILWGFYANLFHMAPWLIP